MLSSACPFLAIPYIGRSILLRATLALKICREVAESGNGNAEFYPGKLYAEGKGIPQNSNEAVRWLRAGPDFNELCHLEARGSAIGLRCDSAADENAN